MLRNWEGEWAASRAAAEADASVTVATEPDPHGPCERCLDPESITTAGDHVASYSARLCGECGALWLRTILGDWDSSLAIFTGNASDDELRHHAELIAQREAAEAERVQRAAEKKAQAAARKTERRNKAEQEADERARAVLAVVTERPRPTLEIATELGVSGRTAGRFVALGQA